MSATSKQSEIKRQAFREDRYTIDNVDLRELRKYLATAQLQIRDDRVADLLDDALVGLTGAIETADKIYAPEIAEVLA